MAEHYFSKKQTSKFIPELIEADLLGNRLRFYTAGGVFSPKKIDRGTLLLIDGARVSDGMRLLDLGCGYGVVGIAMAKKHDVEVVMSDVNERAVKLARMNLKLNKVEGKVVCGDGYEKIEGTFDTILLNPPQTAGKKVCFMLIEGAVAHLKTGGSLQIVARHQKGGKELKKKMESVFGNAEEGKKKGGFRIYISRKE